MSHWTDKAACRDKPVNLFFPRSKLSSAYDPARKVCQGCPVREQCLEYGMKIDCGEGYGMFGGLSPAERRQLATRRRRQVAA